MQSKIILSGNDLNQVDQCKSLLAGENWTPIVTAYSEVKDQAKNTDADLLLLCLSGNSLETELEQITELKKIIDDLPIVVISDNTNCNLAVQLMKMGLTDYMVPPLSKDQFNSTLQKHAKFYHLTKRIFLHDAPGSLAMTFEGMIGRSESMQEIFKVVTAVAKSNATVLITGESGTGKELIAKAIHKKSERANYRFVDLNCGAIPKDLLENELFGHEKGAFTGAHARYQGSFEVAHRGSLFLDEISEMDALLQVKLLRVLQERSFMRIGGTEKIDVDVRIVAATNKILPEEIREGKFREDLFYRLNVVNIALPPLRERREDIPLLTKHFLDYYSAKNNRIFIDFADDAMEVLINYDWPGNIRELENTIERVVVLHNASQVKLKFLPQHIQKVTRAIGYTKEATPKFDSPGIIPLDNLERQAIEAALLQLKGNVTLTAKKLEIGQATLYRKIKKYGLQV